MACSIDKNQDDKFRQWFNGQIPLSADVKHLSTAALMQTAAQAVASLGRTGHEFLSKESCVASVNAATQRELKPGEGHSQERAIVVDGPMEKVAVLRSRGLWSIGLRRVHDPVTKQWFEVERVWNSRKAEFEIWFDCTQVVASLRQSGVCVSPSRWCEPVEARPDSREAFERQGFRNEYKEGRCCHYCWRRSGHPHGSVAVKLRYCSRCHLVPYCGSECQKMDWPSHKGLICKPPVC